MNACRHVNILKDITESQHNLSEAEQKNKALAINLTIPVSSKSKKQ